MTNPLLIPQIHSLHQSATGTPSHVPLRRRGITIVIVRGSEICCMRSIAWSTANATQVHLWSQFHILLNWRFSNFSGHYSCVSVLAGSRISTETMRIITKSKECMYWSQGRVYVTYMSREHILLGSWNSTNIKKGHWIRGRGRSGRGRIITKFKDYIYMPSVHVRGFVGLYRSLAVWLGKWVRSFRQIRIWIITKFERLVQSLMFYAGETWPTWTVLDGNLVSFKHKRPVIWNLVQPRLTHAASADIMKIITNFKEYVYATRVRIHDCYLQLEGFRPHLESCHTY